MTALNPYFSVCEYRVTSERKDGGASRAHAQVELMVGGSRTRSEATGVGPVHALDNALRASLRSDFTAIDRVKLSDYHVSVVNADAGTGAAVRVVVQATDDEDVWEAGCTSDNIIDASFEALCATAVIGLMRAGVGVVPA